jgi:hypothetical protein
MNSLSERHDSRVERVIEKARSLVVFATMVPVERVTLKGKI